MKKQLLFLFFGLLLTSNVSAGGGWTPEKGNGFFMLSQRYIGGSFRANSGGIIGKSPLAYVTTTDLYGEYGITDRFCGILYTPVLSFAYQEGGVDEFGRMHLRDKAVGNGDIDLAVKYKIIDRDIKVAASAWAGINAGNYNGGTTGNLHLGDGEFSQMLRLDASASANAFWMNLYVAFNNRTRNFSDEMRFGGEFGWHKGGFFSILKVNVNKSLFNGNEPDTYSPGIYSNNIEYFGVAPQFLYKFDNNLGLALEAGFALSARNIIASPSLSAGVFYDLKRKK